MKNLENWCKYQDSSLESGMTWRFSRRPNLWKFFRPHSWRESGSLWDKSGRTARPKQGDTSSSSYRWLGRSSVSPAASGWCPWWPVASPRSPSSCPTRSKCDYTIFKDPSKISSLISKTKTLLVKWPIFFCLTDHVNCLIKLKPDSSLPVRVRGWCKLSTWSSSSPSLVFEVGYLQLPDPGREGRRCSVRSWRSWDEVRSPVWGHPFRTRDRCPGSTWWTRPSAGPKIFRPIKC